MTECCPAIRKIVFRFLFFIKMNNLNSTANTTNTETITSLEIQRASKCPYVNCKLNCRSKKSHRARYAYLKLMSESNGQVKTGASIKIDYQKLRALRARIAVNREEIIQDEDNADQESST